MTSKEVREPITNSGVCEGSSSSVMESLLSVEETLNRFHQAAADANGELYFSYFATQQLTPTYFIGTDATERWTLSEFQNYANPYFSKGMGWKYVPQQRNVSYTIDHRVAWFDEILDSERFGTARGSGVLVLEVINNNCTTIISDHDNPPPTEEYTWKIAQYHLTIPVPNKLMDIVSQMIRDVE